MLHPLLALSLGLIWGHFGRGVRKLAVPVMSCACILSHFGRMLRKGVGQHPPTRCDHNGHHYSLNHHKG